MPKSHSVELRDWVATAQSGDKEAFSEIVKRCQDRAYGIAYALLGDPGLAQDAAQEAFIAAYLNLAALREPAAFPGWFRRVVIKHSDRERRSRKPSDPLDEFTEFATPLPDPMRTLEASENRSEIHKAIAELPAIQKQIIILFYLRDYSQKEIEDFLELPVSTIKKHLFTARKKLKGRLETMVETQIQSNRPSQTGVFATEVQYLLASAPATSKVLRPWFNGSLICLSCVLKYLRRARGTTGLWAERPSIGRLLPATNPSWIFSFHAT